MDWLTLTPLVALLAGAPAEDKNFMVTGFDRVRIEGPFQVELRAGSPGAVASGDPRAIAHVAVRVEGSTLIINGGTSGWKLRAVEAPGSARIIVSTPVLRGLAVSGGAMVRVAEMRGARVDLGLTGGGAIEVTAMRADDLGVTLIGDGTITLAGSAVQARLRSYGKGSIEASGLTAGDATLSAQSSGSLSIAVRYTASINATGTGTVTVLGSPRCRVTGPGPVACANR
ncbi:MAG: DUF2807 domain-containing protein [Sphingomonadales bacterium]|nr:MAG: DUF2807 domain-containing protein [Sphingomonadales bacterium]